MGALSESKAALSVPFDNRVTTVSDGAPGLAVAVLRNGQTLHTRGYGIIGPDGVQRVL